jgi:hypothetical protein
VYVLAFVFLIGCDDFTRREIGFRLRETRAAVAASLRAPITLPTPSRVRAHCGAASFDFGTLEAMIGGADMEPGRGRLPKDDEVARAFAESDSGAWLEWKTPFILADQHFGRFTKPYDAEWSVASTLPDGYRIREMVVASGEKSRWPGFSARQPLQLFARIESRLGARFRPPNAPRLLWVPFVSESAQALCT